MKEKEPHEADPYWNADIEAGEGTFYHETYPIRMQLHQSEENYHNHDELFRLKSPNGNRLYFHAKPYLALPDITINVEWQSGVGKATGIVQEGARKELIGQAQGWYYPKDRALMVWECFLEDRHRIENAVEDENLATVWRAFERELVHRSHGVKKIYSTWEDIYPRPLWRRFLESHGYQQSGPAVFEKPVISARTY